MLKDEIEIDKKNIILVNRITWAHLGFFFP
jgi:hypothetical protein